MLCPLAAFGQQSFKACVQHKRGRVGILSSCSERRRKEDVMEIFDILSGKKYLKNATPHVPESLKHLCETSEASNNG